MMESDPFITAIITARLIKNDPGVPQEDVTAMLTDQDKDPLSATFTIYAHKLDTENDSHVSSEGITIPLPLEDETKPDITRYIDESLYITGTVPPGNSNLMGLFSKSEGKKETYDVVKHGPRPILKTVLIPLRSRLLLSTPIMVFLILHVISMTL